jgi:3'-phosphoadenosine 5'-phosphosulfate sulfotransferase
MDRLNECTVVVERWSGGWELYVTSVGGQAEGVTQADSLDDAAQQVRDYLESMYEVDCSGVRVNLLVNAA